MIAIVAKGRCKPETLESFLTLATELATESQREAGCVFYHLTQEQADPLAVAFVECWQDQAAIDTHNQTPHYTRIVPQFAALLDGPMDAKLYDVVK